MSQLGQFMGVRGCGRAGEVSVATANLFCSYFDSS